MRPLAVRSPLFVIAMVLFLPMLLRLLLGLGLFAVSVMVQLAPVMVVIMLFNMCDEGSCRAWFATKTAAATDKTEGKQTDAVALAKGLPDAPLSRHDRERVHHLQLVLIKLGKMVPGAIRFASGLYGPFTRAAVADVQRSIGASPTGVYDAHVRDQLLKELTEVSAPGGETADKKADKKAAVHDVSSAPSVRLEEDKVTVVFAVPGLRSEDLKVDVLDDVLHVVGVTTKTTASGSETTYRVSQDVQLPAVEMETMRATHENGVLSVEVQRKIRRLTIPVSSSTVEVKAAQTKEAETEEAETKEAEGDAPSAAPFKAVEASVEEEEAQLAEWDTCLDDLAEMGFDDRETNRAALAKHSGSIKLAVKELVMKRTAA